MNNTANITKYIPENTLIQFARNKKGERVGVVVATLINNNIRFGWSKVNLSMGDKFDRQRSLEIAVGRAVSGTKEALPSSLVSVMENVVERSFRYFKGAGVSAL
jgi:hypothetical protein